MDNATQGNKEIEVSQLNKWAATLVALGPEGTHRASRCLGAVSGLKEGMEGMVPRRSETAPVCLPPALCHQ